VIADLTSRDLLEREYLFIDVVSTFLRAIRVGVVHTHRGATILAHYGQLEVAFDTCSRVVIDSVREESTMKDDPAIVVSTVTQALQEV
jgi:cohesin complex subunit SA-1/2